MKEIFIPAPSEKQQHFLDDKHKYICYGGARGGGKSWAVRTKAVLLCAQYPGITVLIIRATYPELRENHIRPLTVLLKCYAPRAERIAKYNDNRKEITFPNGSRILFRYCANDTDVLTFQGLECDVMFIDEATNQTEDRVKKLNACVRGVNSFPKRAYYTCNPGGVGHEWVKRLFVDKHYKSGEDPKEYFFIQAGVRDNQALMRENPDYIRNLEALPPKQRAAWLDGDWNIYEGAFFDDFRTTPDIRAANEAGYHLTAEELIQQRRFVHVIPAFDLNAGASRGWNIMRSYDFGYGKPFSCAWWAVDYDGVLYRILELYGCTQTANEGVRWNPDRQFAEIAKVEREHPWLKGKSISGVADPSIWDSSRGESIAETAMKYHVYFTPGDNERIAGWMQCHYRLQFDSEGYPKMYVFDNCEAFIRTVPLMRHATVRVEDLDTTLEDHVCDEWRYTCMSRPITPSLPEEKNTISIDPLNQFKKR